MSEPTQDPESSSVPRALGRLRVALDDAYVRSSRELGLTAAQAELLCAALRPAAVGDIALALRCDRSNVTRLVDRASERGLMRRGVDELDGRVTVIELSPEGRRLAERFISLLEAQTSQLMGEWPEARRRATAEALNQISDTLDLSRQLRRRSIHGNATRGELR